MKRLPSIAFHNEWSHLGISSKEKKLHAPAELPSKRQLNTPIDKADYR